MSHLNRVEPASTIHHIIRIDTRVDSPPLASRASSITSEKKRNRNWEAPAAAAESGRWTKVLRRLWTLPQFLQWIPANFTWENLKPVIRSSIAAWIVVVFFVIPAVSEFMGQVSVVIVRYEMTLCF